jgi:methanogenic corrinoid protein MtbC1
MDRLQQIKSSAEKLPAISEDAITKLCQSLPRLVQLVNEKFLIEDKFCCGKPLDKHMEMVKNIHKNFGGALLAVYQFSLYDVLIDEFAWTVSTLFYRDFGKDYFLKMLNAWIMAIHGTIEPSCSRELIQPLRFLERNLSVFLENWDIPAKLENENQEKFMNLLLEKRRRDATDYTISLLENGKSPDDLCHGILIPAMKQIGVLWQKNQITASDEHAATEITRYVIFRLCDSIPRKQALPYRALVSCVPGEEHELGAEMVASYLESQGWTVYFTGHSAPCEDIVVLISRLKPEVIFLTSTLISNLPSTVQLSKGIRQTVPGSKIILGGRAVVLAKRRIQDSTDAIIADYREAHLTALELLKGNA